MNMDKIDKEIIEGFCNERNLKEVTEKGYTTAIGLYVQFHQTPFHQLLQEAEKEEQENIIWKHSTLRKRLIDFRNHLLQKGHVANTVKAYTSRVQTVYEEGFEIDIGKLPKLNQKNIAKPTPISFNDLPDKELIKKILKIVNPLMRAAILFMTSSGCAKRETLNLTIQGFIDSTYEYHNSNDIYEVLSCLNGRDDVIPSWKLKRQKTNKYYTTFSSPESTTEIINYLLSEERDFKPEDPLFKITATHFNNTFTKINNTLNLGKAGTYNRFRSHMLRKFHASQLYNDGLSMDEVDELQGRGKDQTRTSYFLEDPLRLREKYIEHLNAVTINLDVNNLNLKSPEFVQMETELESKSREVEDLKVLVEKTNNELINRLNRLERETKSKYGYSIDDFELID